jgi:hypothetical protein
VTRRVAGSANAVIVPSEDYDLKSADSETGAMPTGPRGCDSVAHQHADQGAPQMLLDSGGPRQ